MFDDEPYQNAVLGYTERRLAARREVENRQQRHMPDVTTCPNCTLTYYQTSAPHVCAGWVEGVKENVEVSKICNDHPWEKCPKCGVGICQEHMVAFLNHRPHYTEHEPVARGGEGERDEWRERLQAIRQEERRAAFREAIAIIVGQPTTHYIYSGATPMAAETFRDNAIGAIEAIIAIEQAKQRKIEAAANETREGWI